MDSEDGELFVKQLALFVKTNEKALANAAPSRRPGNAPRHGPSKSVSSITPPKSPATIPDRPLTASSATTLTPRSSTFSLGALSFSSQNVKAAKLALTPHHLFYLLSRFEELGIEVGPMKVRLENLHDTSTSANYVSFLGESQRTKSRGSDVASIRSTTSVRSVMNGMSSLLSSFGIGASISAARMERQKAAAQQELKFLYSAFTKIPCLRLAPDWRAKLIRGYEEFPFDSAVPLYVFKNLSILEVSGIDYRQFFGWDRLAEQVRSLTLKRASIEDPADILVDIVLDDMGKRRRRATKAHSPTGQYPQSRSRRSPARGLESFSSSLSASPDPRDPRRGSVGDFRVGSISNESVDSTGSRRPSIARAEAELPVSPRSRPVRNRSISPRPATSRHQTTNNRGGHKVKRSGSGSSHSSMSDSVHNPRNSASNLLAMGVLPSTKWRFLRHLSLADNSLTTVSPHSLAPLANTLHSLDLSTNLFTQIPDSLATLESLRALNLSHCMIDSLHSLLRNPLPAISALNLRANRLQSIAGIERLYPLERLDLRDNRLTDPMELARLTGIPDLREVWIEGNPFTRTHRDYRITIFNLFRQTPGYTEDIIIDATGPSYNERRYLVERVAVPPAVAVVKPPVAEVPTVDLSKPAIIYDAPSKEDAILRKERTSRPAPKAVASEVHTTATRRRRTPKRRIVDLATNDDISSVTQTKSADSVVDRSPTLTEGGENYRVVQSSTEQTSSQASPTKSRPPNVLNLAEVPRIDTTNISRMSADFPQDTPSVWTQPHQDWDAAGEAYRQKIEALRDSVGNGYLTILNEESWETNRSNKFVAPDLSPEAPIRPNTSLTRTSSAQVI